MAEDHLRGFRRVAMAAGGRRSSSRSGYKSEPPSGRVELACAGDPCLHPRPVLRGEGQVADVRACGQGGDLGGLAAEGGLLGSPLQRGHGSPHSRGSPRAPEGARQTDARPSAKAAPVGAAPSRRRRAVRRSATSGAARSPLLPPPDKPRSVSHRKTRRVLMLCQHTLPGVEVGSPGVAVVQALLQKLPHPRHEVRSAHARDR